MKEDVFSFVLVLFLSFASSPVRLFIAKFDVFVVFLQLYIYNLLNDDKKKI